MTDLKTCPFCGGGADPEGWLSTNNSRGPACDDCGAIAQIANWNTRPREAQLEAEVAELRAKLAVYEGQLTAEEMREKCLKAADTKEPRCMVEDYDQGRGCQRMITVAAISALSTKREEG